MGAIVTATSYQAATGQTVTGDALTALSRTCESVSDALSKYLRPYSPVPVTLSGYIADAPTSNVLVLPVLPVRTLTSVYLRWGADGDSASFTSDDLLTVNDDYWMPTDPFDGYSRDGKVFRRGVSMWAYEYRYAHRGSLSPTLDPNRGAIKLTATCGETSVPDAVHQAAVLMVSLVYGRRKTGMPVTNESWNGYSYGASGPFTAVSALDSPDVQAYLRAYRPALCHTAGD
jgi:hypothetical protein